ncbi:MAG: phosphatase PAP2 family protein [Chthoniobacterales bacterium]
MKDKREFRRRVSRWVVIFVGAAVLIGASFCLDPAVRNWVTRHQDPAMRRVMEAVSRYGDWPEHVALGVILLAAAWSRGSKRWMRIFAAMIVACALAGGSARVVKIAAGRARPNVQTETRWNGPQLSERYHAFPSGHTAASTAFFATLVLAGWRIGGGLFAIPLLIAFSRMYVAAHYLSDVVAAAIIGVACAYVVVGWRPLAIKNGKSKVEN